MTLKQRLDKLEKQQPGNSDAWVRVIVHPHETETAALARWQDENPGVSPENIIYRLMIGMVNT